MKAVAIAILSIIIHKYNIINFVDYSESKNRIIILIYE